VEDGLSLDDGWRGAQLALATPFFDLLRDTLAALPRDRWPTRSELTAIAEERGIRNARGMPLRFVTSASERSAMAYETRIAESGEIPTRDNFHDLFNALQWLTLPRTKSTISASHAALLQAGGDHEAKSRSRERDVLTMFDESGVVVMSEDQSLLDLIRSFQWKQLFVERRAEVITSMRFVLVGHGLMEKALNPFIGLTGKAMLLNVPTHADIDGTAAHWLSEKHNLSASRNLAPLPLLGIPGWDVRNEDAAFYDNTGYFRAGYTREIGPAS
jgi:hypothetical protein